MPEVYYRCSGEKSFTKANTRWWVVDVKKKSHMDSVMVYRSTPRAPWEEAEETEPINANNNTSANFGEFIRPSSAASRAESPKEESPENRKISYTPFKKREAGHVYEDDTGSMTDYSDISASYYSDENTDERIARERRNEVKREQSEKRRVALHTKYFTENGQPVTDFEYSPENWRK